MFFAKGVEELVVKILEKYTYRVSIKFFSKTEIVNLRIWAINN